MKHKWTVNDDIVALYLYLYGDKMLGKGIEEISKKLDILSKSMAMRIANFKSISGCSGLDHYAKQSKEVFEKYKNYNKEELGRIVKEIIK